MSEECEFVKYTERILEEGFDKAPHYSYGYLLNKCTCEQCMKEKEYRKRYKLWVKIRYVSFANMKLIQIDVNDAKDGMII